MIWECVILSEYRTTIAKLRLHRMNYTSKETRRRSLNVSLSIVSILTWLWCTASLNSLVGLIVIIWRSSYVFIYVHTRRMYICIHVVYINGKIIERTTTRERKVKLSQTRTRWHFPIKATLFFFLVCCTRLSFSYTLCCLLSKRCACVYIIRDAASFLSLSAAGSPVELQRKRSVKFRRQSLLATPFCVKATLPDE